LNYLAKRLGVTLIIAGLTIIIACISTSGEQVRKENILIGLNKTAALSYYLHDNDVEFVIEIIPSRAKADILLLDAEQLKSAIQVADLKPLVELKNVDNADFKLEHKRGLYFLFIVNRSEEGISAYITRISSGVQQDIVYTGIGTIILGLACLITAKLVKNKNAG